MGTLQITVVSELDQPLADCLLRIAGGGPDGEARTDARGRADLTLACDRYMLDVTPPNAQFGPASGRVTVEPGEQSFTIVLQSQGDLPFCARLRRSEPSVAAAGVRAVLCLRGERHDELLSDRDGLLQVLASRSDCALEIPAGPHGGPCFVAVLPGHETPATAFEVALPAAASLRVTVVDGAERPLSGQAVRIAVRREDMTFPAGAFTRLSLPEAEAVTDAVGEVTADGLPAAARALVEVQVGRMPVTVEHRLQPGSNRLIVRVESASLSGRLLDLAGAPLAGVEVGVEFWPSPQPPPAMRGSAGDGRNVRTGDDGSFRFEQLGAGGWLVGVVVDPAAARPLAPVCRRVELQAGRDTAIELRAPRGGFVEGAAVLPGGTPAAGVVLDLMSPSPGSRYVLGGRTGGDGRFRLGPLPDGAWSIHTDVFDAAYGLLRPEPVRTGDADVRLQLQRTMADASVLVVDATGHARRAWVGMFHRAGDALGGHTGLDGRFEHAGLRAGTWDLHADDGSGGVANLFGVDLQPAERPALLRLQLAPGGTLLVRCPLDPEQELCCQQGDHVGYIDNVEPGEVRRIALSPGRWQVELRAGGRVLRQGTATVVAGREGEPQWQ